jgi:hypothetical protein
MLGTKDHIVERKSKSQTKTRHEERKGLKFRENLKSYGKDGFKQVYDSI